MKGFSIENALVTLFIILVLITGLFGIKAAFSVVENAPAGQSYFMTMTQAISAVLAGFWIHPGFALLLMPVICYYVFYKVVSAVSVRAAILIVKLSVILFAGLSVFAFIYQAYLRKQLVYGEGYKDAYNHVEAVTDGSLWFFIFAFMGYCFYGADWSPIHKHRKNMSDDSP